MSCTGARNHARAMRENNGLPNQRCSGGMAPGRTRPPPDWQPAALHQIVAVPELRDELRQLAEVVAVVRVAHDHEAPASRLRCLP